MKEYKVVCTDDERLFPPKKGWTDWTVAERFDQLEHHINNLAADGWVLKSSSGTGELSLQNLIVILERDKPEGGATA